MLFIRVDANEKIGIGHMMRCMAIAKEAMHQNKKCTFIVSDNKSKEEIEKFGFSTICLNSKWNDMEYEIDILSNLISEYRVSVLIVDSYYVTKKYIEEIGQITKFIYLGDLKYSVENLACLINYNNYYEKFNYDITFKNKNTILLLGMKFTPLREEFCNIKTRKSVKKNVSKILITTGGTDPNNMAGKLANYIVSNDNHNISLDIVVGSLNKNLRFLYNIEKEKSNIKLHIDTDNIAMLMSESDIAVSAGGTTLYELSACGVPTICYAFVDNQLDSINEFMKNEIMISVGDIRGKESEVIKLIYEKICFLRENYGVRNNMTDKMYNLIDNKGCYRIIKHINKLLI
ncbi:UDP-2,4-diacetamido-2,4,6-trideoxy-beta-L-altropyranose hydrolase [Clostridium botulinum]|uniref:UDP-2,4-diacetamido-2,4, 6-trideoxy-beta-L-altropyranose hydrolase n=1 Tax=Clostridium botulinum TaxID=1491 RepID=UPI00052D0444|nr:UDP-2,4-diacetamido-2,4,6-trideoxy-beta-L-altropyranose hydrolase [Clostridium botulinum]KGM96560.1 hypothetical protein Z956_02945 [Clostridium botulinum D str. CCUG 7971]KOC48474.1 hypothetical protein ADU88_07655 [Clostridium botulinum]NFO98722.1 UDP-2,4-diacetamido-2,4,6-trideoxy-beta-L-altropyranose hydrolase [Clostridium botulinum]OOV50629.1 UDP-2,4-diacetamido-2,4,6-trideoxy-beta-L-altropyranose hydrolase [Clostridium botulinum D/C]OOV55471.1 UDP-2,4-diacetamido-2,4,6-trideoxy-beta-L